MRLIKVNGVNIYYESSGAGYPVVFLHGFAGSARMWAPQVGPFSQRYRFITYDARGHARSESPRDVDEYSGDIAVEDLYELLKALGIRRAVIGGLSMGGYIALRFCIRHPESVDALVLMGTGPGYRNPERRAEWNETQEIRARRLEKMGIKEFIDDPATLKAIPYATREQLMEYDPIGLAHSARRVSGQHDSLVIDGLGNIRCPSLVVVGERDRAFLQAADFMAGAIPGARKVVVPNARHGVNLDNPVVMNREVLGFLAGLKLG